MTRDLWISCGYYNGTAVVSSPCTGITLTVLGHGGSNGTLLSGANQTAALVDSYTQLKIDFHTTQPDSFVVIWTGGHLAKSSFWNTLTDTYKAEGAVGERAHRSTSASSPMRLGSMGNKDNQLQAGVVVPPGNITIVKDDLANSRRRSRSRRTRH